MTDTTCIVCGRLDARDARGVHCGGCGLELSADADGVLAIDAEEADVSYPKTGADTMLQVEETSFWFRHRDEVLALVLDRFAAPGPIWDVGGGNGFHAKKLAERGREVVVVEPGAGSANAARRGVPSVVRAPLERLRLPDGSLSTILLLDVIEHIADPGPTLRECRRVLRPDGRVIITVPAYEALWSDEDDYAEHHRRYSRPLVSRHLADAGLELEWASHFFGALIAPVFLFRALPFRMRRAMRGAGPAKTSETAAASEHNPGGVAQRIVGALLAREVDALRAHLGLGPEGTDRKNRGSLAFGTSIVAVAAPG